MTTFSIPPTVSIPMPMAHAPKSRPPQAGPLSHVGRPHELLDVDRIDPGVNDRDEEDLAGDSAELHSLAESLQAIGSIHPIMVEPGGVDGRFTIIAGERRWRAARLAGWRTIPAFVCRGMSTADKVRLAIDENVERKDLCLLALARGLARLVKPIAQGGAGMTREAVAQRYRRKGGSWVTNIIKLLRLPPFWQQRIASGQLGQREGRSLVPYVDRPEVLGAVERDLKAHPELWDGADKFELRLSVIVARLDGQKTAVEAAEAPAERPETGGVSPDTTGAAAAAELGEGPVRRVQRRSAPVDHSLPAETPQPAAGGEQQPQTIEQILAAVFDLLDRLRADQLGPVVTYTDRRARGINGPEARLPSRRARV